MITEIAQIDVKRGTEKGFEAAVAKARPLFLRAKGGKGFELHKSIEKPSRYRLMAKWETLENHTVDFRGSEDFTAWRGLVGPYFALPPEGEHPAGADLRLNARQGYAAPARHPFTPGAATLHILPPHPSYPYHRPPPPPPPHPP